MDVTAHSINSNKRIFTGRNRGFTILELLTVMGITAILAALILPAVGSAREAARRLQCGNNLHQIGLALHNYHDQYRCLPPGWQWAPQHRTAYGWAVAILPQLDQLALSRGINRGVEIGDGSNELAASISLPVYLCPSDITTPHFTMMREGPEAMPATPLLELPTASYVGVFGVTEPDDIVPTPPGEGAFIDARPIRFSEFLNGTSNTVMIGERSMRQLPGTWYGFSLDGEDHTCRVVGNMQVAPNCTDCDECEFGSRHPGVSQFLWADGHVANVSNSIDSTIYQKISLRSGVSPLNNF